MKPRTCFSERTPPLQPIREFGAPPSDSPALRRLISVGLGATLLWGCWSVGSLFHSGSGAPCSQQSASPVVTDATRHSSIPSGPSRVERALPVTKRALPVPGATYPATLPDGQQISATWKGSVPSFSDLPKHPSIGDEFGVKEGQGVSWIWATPYGWNHPAWIDP